MRGLWLTMLAAGAHAAQPTGYAGSASCTACHRAEAVSWAASHHARAMAPATQAAVLGDFNDTRVAFRGSAARLYRAGGQFMARIDGADGKPGDFAVTQTLGVSPLQQYLVSFPDGRKQALPWAWDTRATAAGGQRWIYLYQDGAVAAGDPLHWTGLLQNWNFMCAECHVTGLRKNYDPTANVYHSVTAEIGVGCESCHGPGAGHVAWARDGAKPLVPQLGFATMMAKRPAADWSVDARTGSPAHGVARPAGGEEDVCAQCHSRRAALAEDWRPGRVLTQTHLPDFLAAGLFEDDGQMKDEVFNDQSFQQSLMYARGVQCSDCHNPHSGALKLAGAAVCSQCHVPARFNAVAHTGHLAGAKAPDCIACHMPARTYMVIDRRHDHSFRIPRPDISVKIGTPNACNDCHTDKSAAWAADAVARWHPGPPHGHQTWAEAVHRARAGDPAVRPALLALAGDTGVPAIARATVLTELAQFLGRTGDAVVTRALIDPDPVVRIAALRGLAGLPLAARWAQGAGLLGDPVAGVRMEAALLLADQAVDGLAPDLRARFEAACAAYVAAQRLAADRPEGRGNLADFLRRRGDAVAAEAEYKAGLRLSPRAAALAVNLADLYRAQGREAAAEAVLRAAITAAPEAAAAHHALGLSLIRQKNYADGVAELGRAVRLAPDDAGFAYVYAVALQSTGAADAARPVIAAALARHPHDARLLRLAPN